MGFGIILETFKVWLVIPVCMQVIADAVDQLLIYD